MLSRSDLSGPGLSVLLLWWLQPITSAAAQEQVSDEGRHRLDLSVTADDTGEADLYKWLPAYTVTVANQFRLGITTSYTYASADEPGAELGIESNSGLGDTYFNAQFTPTEKLTSSPWVPDSMGFMLGLTSPTGDAEEGLGGDQWTFSIGLGWAYPAWSNVHLIPSASYETSFSEGSEAQGLEYLGFSLGIYWVEPNGFWIGYTPYLERDLDFYEWSETHSIVIGKMWPGGLGLSVEYGKRDRIDPIARRDDYTGMINFYYQFGKAP